MVDDEPSVAFLVRRLLERAGCKVFVENDSVKAMEFLKGSHGKIDLLICDMTMPKLTGERLILEALTNTPDMHAILMSGNTFRLPDVLQDFSTVMLLEKPIEMHNLYEALQHVLKNHD